GRTRTGSWRCSRASRAHLVRTRTIARRCRMRAGSFALVSILGACTVTTAGVDLGGPGDDGGAHDASSEAAGAESGPGDDGGTSSSDAPTANDAPPTQDGGGGLGTVTKVTDATCPAQSPPGATCKTVTVEGCPGIESESIDATVAILSPTGA